MSGSERRKVTESAGWKKSGKAIDAKKVNDKSIEEELGKVWESSDKEICHGCRSRVNTGQM